MKNRLKYIIGHLTYALHIFSMLVFMGILGVLFPITGLIWLITGYNCFLLPIKYNDKIYNQIYWYDDWMNILKDE